jgi:cytochrome c oxidase subunit 2
MQPNPFQPRRRAPSLTRRGWLVSVTAVAAGAAALLRIDALAAPRVIRIHARRFVFTPNRITLAPHERVQFELTAEDTLMGFSIPQFGVRADVPPGTVVKLTAEAGDAGTVPFLCDIFCGSGHETMNGVIIVG